MFRYLIVIVLGLIFQGCVYTSYTSKLDHPIERTVSHSDFFTLINESSESILSASVGDELFVMNRFVAGIKEVVRINPPTGNPFPFSAIWSRTHKFNDGKSGDLYVYTTPTYYNGTIGVILDNNEQLATAYPLVQVEGSKVGRRWRLNATGNFFSINVDSWALRYGGNNNNQYVFEIVNKLESKTIEVLQTIHIDESKFKKGFIIRNVLILGLSVDEYGVIRYKISDVGTKT